MELTNGPGAPLDRNLADRVTLAVGCFASICRDRLGDKLLDFAREWPAVDVGVHEMPRGDLLAGARDGALDVAVLPGGPRDDLCSAQLWADRAMVAMAADHRLVGEAAVAPAALARERLLVSRQQHGGEMHRFLAGRVAPLTPLGGALCNMGLPRLLEQVAAGQGVALVCASHAALLSAAVVIRPVAAAGGEFVVSAYWREARPQWPLSALIAVLRSEPA